MSAAVWVLMTLVTSLFSMASAIVVWANPMTRRLLTSVMFVAHPAVDGRLMKGFTMWLTVLLSVVMLRLRPSLMLFIGS